MTARQHIARIQQETPSLTRRVIESLWQDVLEEAIREVENELDQDIPPMTLTWQEVFEDEYRWLKTLMRMTSRRTPTAPTVSECIAYAAIAFVSSLVGMPSLLAAAEGNDQAA
jgi:hypothetical protein